MLTENERLEFHTFLKKFIKQIHSSRDIHLFVFYFGLINGCCYDIATLSNYAQLTPEEITSIIDVEINKYHSIIYQPNYTLIEQYIPFVTKIQSHFPLDKDYLTSTFYKYLCDITYIPINTIFPFMVKLLSHNTPSNTTINHILSSYSSLNTNTPYNVPFKTTEACLSDFMYNSLYEYDKLELYKNHLYFKDFNLIKEALEHSKHPSYSPSYTNYKELINWPNVSHVPYRPINSSMLKPRRTLTSKKPSSKSSTIQSYINEFYSNKLHRYVYYESSLEYKFYQNLENDPTVDFYCEQPFRIYYVPSNHISYYIPDVIITFKDGSHAIVELKALNFMAQYDNLRKYNRLKEYCTKYNYGYMMFDCTHSISYLKNRILNKDFISCILSALKQGTLDLKQYQKLSNLFEPSSTDLFALIVQYNLFYNTYPFILGLYSK